MNLPKNFLGQIAACSALALAGGAANADTYDFVLTGTYSAHWTLNSSPTPDGSDDGFGFGLIDVVGTFPGASQGLVDITFFHADYDGGMAIDDYYGEANLMLSDGVQLYTGTEDAPTFKLGTFALGEYQGTGTYTLKITNVSAVPEPESYAMLLAGIGALGFVAARRRKS